MTEQVAVLFLVQTLDLKIYNKIRKCHNNYKVIYIESKINCKDKSVQSVVEAGLHYLNREGIEKGFELAQKDIGDIAGQIPDFFRSPGNYELQSVCIKYLTWKDYNELGCLFLYAEHLKNDYSKITIYFKYFQSFVSSKYCLIETTGKTVLLLKLIAYWGKIFQINLKNRFFSGNKIGRAKKGELVLFYDRYRQCTFFEKVLDEIGRNKINIFLETENNTSAGELKKIKQFLLSKNYTTSQYTESSPLKILSYGFKLLSLIKHSFFRGNRAKLQLALIRLMVDLYRDEVKFDFICSNYKPKAFLVNAWEVDRRAPILCQVADHYNVKTFNTMNGWKDDRPLNRLNNFTKWFIWGEYQNEILTKIGNDAKQFDIIGHLQADRLSGFSDKDVVALPGLPEGKKIISVFPQPILGYITKEVKFRLAETILKAAESFPDCLFVIKPHPAERDGIVEKTLNKVENAIILDHNFDLYSLLFISEVVITVYSTVSLEALMLGKPVILTNYIGVPNPIPFGRDKIADEVFDTSSALKAMEKILNSSNESLGLQEKQRRKMLVKYVAYMDGKNYLRLATRIKEQLNF